MKTYTIEELEEIINELRGEDKKAEDNCMCDRCCYEKICNQDYENKCNRFLAKF